MRVLLARHGETDWNVRKWVQGGNDIPLNEKGLRQAERLGKLLAGKSIQGVYTSTLSRARMTAEIAAKHINVPCEPRPGLEEICLGDWEGHSWDEIESGWRDLHRRWEADKRNVRPPNGETYREMLGRFIPAVLDIVREARGDVLIVTHSACMLAFQAELNRTSLNTMIRDYAAPNGKAVPVDADAILKRWSDH